MTMGHAAYAILFEDVNVVLDREFICHDKGANAVAPTTRRPSPSIFASKMGTPPFDLARRF